MHPKLKKWLLITLIPVAYALIMRFAFDLDIFDHFLAVMSISFLLFVPFAMGFLTIFLSRIEDIQQRRYRIFMPWVPILAFFFITMVLSIEGWACWLMITPVFLAVSSLGGLTAARIRLKRHDNRQKLNVSLALLLPFFCAPLEKMIPPLPARYEAYTYIDITAPRDKIWGNVVRVRGIGPDEDRGTLTNWLGFPRPIRAELNFAGVGGSRKAVFSKGLVFEEVVQEYQPEKKMHFSIKADPYAIPSTTMDKHIVIGGDYFDVLDGTYELQQLNGDTYRLHLYSHFTMKTTFNFYAGWWGRLIMKDIQNNILQVIQTRSQGRL